MTENERQLLVMLRGGTPGWTYHVVLMGDPTYGVVVRHHATNPTVQAGAYCFDPSEGTWEPMTSRASEEVVRCGLQQLAEQLRRDAEAVAFSATAPVTAVHEPEDTDMEDSP